MPAAFAPGSSTRGGSSVGQSSGLIIRRSQVQVLPAPPIYLRFCRHAVDRWDESGTNGADGAGAYWQKRALPVWLRQEVQQEVQEVPPCERPTSRAGISWRAHDDPREESSARN